MATRMEDPIATVVGLWRYPVKSMMGEELAAADLMEYGLLGDRQYAVVDSETGKIASAKNPAKWAPLFACRATYLERPTATAPAPRVQITLPNGTEVSSDQHDIGAQLSSVLGRAVHLAVVPPSTPILEEYWPTVEGLPHADTVTDESMPPGTFFDCASVHLITTATLDRLAGSNASGRFEPQRFRPNILVSLSTPGSGFIENDWVGRILCIGEQAQLRITGSCGRCVMTTLPQGDLPQDTGILQTAVKENHGSVGIYATVVRGGTIRRKDSLRFQEKDASPPNSLPSEPSA